MSADFAVPCGVHPWKFIAGRQRWVCRVGAIEIWLKWAAPCGWVASCEQIGGTIEEMPTVMLEGGDLSDLKRQSVRAVRVSLQAHLDLFAVADNGLLE